MHSPISTTQVAAQPIAAVRARMAAREIPRRFTESLDKVWAFLRLHPELRAGGHNLFLYRHDMDASGAMTIDFGVQVSREFEAEGEVFCAMTPAGEAATVRHTGAYSELGQSHAAVHAWMKENGRRDGGYSWEIYGDPAAGPAQTETDIFYLLG